MGAQAPHDAAAPAADAPCDPLTRLAIRHGTDKFGQHLYTPVYHRLLRHLRDAPIRLLEIGVGWPNVSLLGGASLRMWRDYFPFARLVGLDVQSKRLDLGPRVTVVQGAQGDADLLRRVWDAHGPFDLVIDDGSHRASDVLASFETLFPLLPPGGFYAVEDVQTAFWPEFGGSPTAGGTILSRLHELVLAMHAPEVRAVGGTPAAERFGAITAAVQVHRNLVVFERGRNDYPSNRGLAMDHPAVADTLRRLDAERAAEPSAGEALIRSGMLEVAGRLPDALLVARQGLEAHPGSLALLCTVHHLSTRLGLAEESRDALRRLCEAAPDEPVFRRIAEQLSRPA